MPKEPDFETIYTKLKALLIPYQEQLVLKVDNPGNYYLNVHYTRPDGYQVAFGGVQIKKNYISYHLMPVYAHPELLEQISPELQKRMQGKSCFNFKTLNDSQLEELGELTRLGFEKFKAAGLI